MLVLGIDALVAATLVVLFIGITVGLRGAHPTDLALQPPTLLAVLARRVVGLYVRKDVPRPQAAIRLRRLVGARSGPHAREDHRAHAEQKPAS